MDHNKETEQPKQESAPLVELEATNQPLDEKNEQAKKPRKKLKIVFIIVSAIALLSAIGIGVIFVSLNGGVQGIINELKAAPDPSSESVEQARERVLKSNTQSIDEAVLENWEYFATSKHDKCYEGQNNFKRQDDYAHKCLLRTTQYYGFSGEFRDVAMAFGVKLRSTGWEAASDSMEELVQRYEKYTQTEDEYFLSNFPNGYLVSDLFTPRYSKDTAVLEMGFAESKTTSSYSIESIQKIIYGTFPTYEVKDFIDVNSLFWEVIADYDYVVAVSVEDQYFEN